ncbi:MAG: SDR family NAD(P)-dependent oxidoreductase [Alphaproteobacteria bacterium]
MADKQTAPNERGRPGTETGAEVRPFAGQHAIVTGGSRGIGAAIARELARRGAELTLVGRNAEPLSSRCQELERAFTVPATAALADVTDEPAIARVMAEACERRTPSILVNNAGGTASAPFQRTAPKEWRATIELNLTGSYLCARAVVPAMTEAGYGRIVNVASTAGLKAYRYVAAYCAAKHGVIGLTRALALELATTGVTVNAVCPGFTDTALVRDSIPGIAAKTGATEDQVLARIAAHNPQERLVDPDEVAGAVAWLCLPSSASITGQAIAIAGGEVM